MLRFFSGVACCLQLADAGLAEDTWADLEELAKGRVSEVSRQDYWQHRLVELHELHPHPESSAVLSWLYLFGLPSDSGSEFLVERDIDKAVQVARDGGQSNCARCFALLGFLMSLGHPLLGAAHLAGQLLFVGDHGGPGGRRPRDVGPQDVAAAAYGRAAQLGDALGILATSYLRQKGLINERLKAPMANQASCMICRKPHVKPLNGVVAEGDGGLCTSTLREQLGPLATDVVEQLDNSTWGPVLQPLTERKELMKDTAFVEHVLADVANAEASDLSQAAALLESHQVELNDLPATSKRHADVPRLYATAAQRGEPRAALRRAVELLQRNDSENAKPLLEQVSSQSSSEAMSAMAQYYLTRFNSTSSEDKQREEAWPHLLRAADLGRPDAELLVAHAHLNPTANHSANSTEAIRRYRRLINRSTDAVALRRGNLSEVQAFAAYNLGVLSLQNLNETSSCSVEAQRLFQDVALSHGHLVRLALALERRAERLKDLPGALLLAMLLSDVGHDLGHLDAAHLWDRYDQVPHFSAEEEEHRPRPCDLQGWWTTNSSELLFQNVSKLFASRVKGGGFEMFNATENMAGNSLELEMVFPRPETSEFQHLHSFLWHSTYDAFPNGAPVPVALQPPNAVPHLVEFHHQRGKLTMDKSCQIASVEGMFVNWTFQRLHTEEMPDVNTELPSAPLISQDSDKGTHNWLHCWVRPERYYVALKAALAAPEPEPEPGTWEEVMSLTSSKDCPCYGAFACRRGDGACEVLAKPSAGAGEDFTACRVGSSLCREVPLELDPPHSNWAALPEVCAFYFYRRAAADGHIDAMHVLSHAYSNGHRGAPKDPEEAFAWSHLAMAWGDLRGFFDVAYSMDFGLGTTKAGATKIYQDILKAQGLDSESFLGQAAARFLSLANSGRYASRLLYQAED